MSALPPKVDVARFYQYKAANGTSCFETLLKKSDILWITRYRDLACCFPSPAL